MHLPNLRRLPVVRPLTSLGLLLSRKIHIANVKPTSAPPNSNKHLPVLLNEVIENLAPTLDSCSEPKIIDMTFGCGGHTKAILERWPHSKVICVDRDPSAFTRCEDMTCSFVDGSSKMFPVLGRFRDLPAIIQKNSLIKDIKADAVLFDLGVSSPQFDDPTRGFSLSSDGPLDMRMGTNSENDSPSASDVVNQLPVKDLAKILKVYGEERHADEIARAIVDHRNSRGPITRSLELASIVKAVSGRRDSYRDKMGRYAHPATRTFQALRIFVNDELNELCHGLEAAYELLRPSGRCLVISFHSLEDRIVKRIFHGVNITPPVGVDDSQLHTRLKSSTEPFTAVQMAALISRKWKPILSKSSVKGGGHHNIIVPCQKEIEANPRARSAKLRVAEKM